MADSLVRSSALMETSASTLDLTNPDTLAVLASEKASVSLTVRFFLAFAKTASAAVRRSNGAVNRRLADLLEHKVPASDVPDRGGVSSKDVVINTQASVWARIFLPPAARSTDSVGDGVAKMPDSAADEAAANEKRRVIFYIHGGGFSVMSADNVMYDQFCRSLCRRTEAVVISINYRRAPEHRYPVAYDDCYSVLEWLEGYQGDLFEPLKLDLRQCVLMGDSAGANIIHHAGSKWGARDQSTHSHSLHVAAHVLLFPFFGGEERTPAELRMHKTALLVNLENSDWHWQAYLPHGSDRDHPACNVVGPNAPSLSTLHLPRSLVVIGELDILKDWQVRYAQGLMNASKPVRLLFYPGGVHCFHILGDKQRGRAMLSDIVAFLEDGGGGQDLKPAAVAME